MQTNVWRQKPQKSLTESTSVIAQRLWGEVKEETMITKEHVDTRGNKCGWMCS